MKKTMKKTLAIVLAIFMIVSTVPVAFAATEVANGTAGEGITWVLDSDGTLTISGTGEMDTSWYSPPWQEYNDLIKNIVVEEGVTEVSDTAFAYAENLVTVSLPSTVTYIDTLAFWSNYSLESINVAEENTTYKDIDGVLFTEDEKTLVAYPANKSGTEYTIPANVTTIEESAFSFNISLESLTIPDTVTTLGEYTFESSELDTIIVGNGITEISRGCFARSSVKTVVISDSVKAINYAAFWDAYELETLIIGSGVETIDSYFLRYTDSLSAVHYKGTQETWDAISINEENADLNSKTLHFISADSYKAQVAATCADGHTAGYYCDECNAYLTGEVIPAVDEHTPGAEVEENVAAPDCTTAGSKDVVTYCTVCGEEVSRETVETAEALGHTSGEAVEENIVAPDCTTPGSKVVVTYCTVCGEEASRETVETAEALGHTPGEAVEENIVSPDCTTPGSKDVVTYCTVCGEEASRETVETAEALGHDWNNSVCDTCGETCAHNDNDYDEICDDCGAEVLIEAVELDETNTVYIPEEHVDVVVKFTPTETGEYVIYSDNGGDDENIDPYVDIYDSNGDEVEDDDDHNGSYNFYCIFEAEAGETYYIELSCYDGDVEYDYTIEKHVDISHQPTAGEPYVELTWDVDADYQWYSVEVGDAEATDENVEAYSYDGETATYDSENGWTPIIDADNYYSSATLELEEGDTVVVEFAESGFGRFGFYDWEQGNESGNGSEIDGILTYECTIDEDGVYTFFTKYPLAHKIYANIKDYVVIEGETEATLQNTEIGTKYACKVTLENGDVLTSDGFENVYAITHQPTTEEPYVELNDDTDATYQWYSVKEKTVEITDENAEGRYADGDECATYDANDGWTGVAHAGTDETNFFKVELEAGQQVSMSISEDVSEFGIWSDNGNDDYWYDLEANETVYFTASADDTYYVYAYCSNDARVRAYTVEYEYTAINGETDALYAPTEEGLYACEVTFADDTTEMSDMFEGPHIHTDGETVEENYVAPTCDTTGSKDIVVYCSVCDAELSRETETIDATGHNDADNDGYCDGCDECVDPSVECDHNCHKGGIVGFFWKIANFFNRIFGTKQYCDCGIAHY